MPHVCPLSPGELTTIKFLVGFVCGFFLGASVTFIVLIEKWRKKYGHPAL